MSTDFERLGGEQGLRAVIDDFVDRVFDDVMIGFHFGAASRDRIKAKEYEFAARHLGAPVDYTGRPLADAHGTHRILGGQFVRRLTILAETLRDHDAPAEVIEAWLAHNEQLRDQITGDPGSSCNPPAPRPLPTRET